MLTSQISFGINTYDGKPYASTCRGKVTFEKPADAAEFIKRRALAKLTADQTIEDVPFVVELRDGGPGVKVRR